MNLYSGVLSGISEGCGSTKGNCMSDTDNEKSWNLTIESLRYGFDESYDSPFDDEDEEEEE